MQGVKTAQDIPFVETELPQVRELHAHDPFTILVESVGETENERNYLQRRDALKEIRGFLSIAKGVGVC